MRKILFVLLAAAPRFAFADLTPAISTTTQKFIFDNSTASFKAPITFLNKTKVSSTSLTLDGTGASFSNGGSTAFSGQLKVSSAALILDGAGASASLADGLGASFKMTGGSTTITGQVKVSSAVLIIDGAGGAVQFADGTQQNTTALTGGSSITFSGLDSFTNTINFNKGSTVTVSGFANFPIMVSSQDVISILNGSPQTNYTTMTITGLQPWEVDASSINWLFTWSCNPSSSTAQLAIGFNGDNGANYNYDSCSGGSAGDVCQGGATDHVIDLDGGGTATVFPQIGGLHFRTQFQASNNVVFNGSPTSGHAAYAYYIHINGQYKGSSVVSTINFTSTTLATSSLPNRAMPLNCHFELWRNVPLE